MERNKATREVLSAWMKGDGVDFSKYTEELDWAPWFKKVAVHRDGPQIRATLFDPNDADLKDASVQHTSKTSENRLPQKLGELQRALAPEPNAYQKRTRVNVKMVDLDGFLDFLPRPEVITKEELIKEWAERGSHGWNDCSRGSLVLELIADHNFTSDAFLSTSTELRAILELKWLRMGKLASFRLGLTVLWALSFTAFSAMRQYTEFDDNQRLIWICLVLSIMQVVVMLALLGRWVYLWRNSEKEVSTPLVLLAIAMILIPILFWATVALATGQILWLLNCLSTFAVLIELKEMLNPKTYFTDPWNMIELLRSTASLLMVCILLGGLTEPGHTLGIMSILTFLGWVQIAKEVRGTEVFGVYVSLICGVMRKTFTFLLLVMLCVIALTFGWWVLSMQRPDAHFLTEEASIQCVKTETGYVCGSDTQSHSSMFTRLWASFTFSYRASLLADYPGDAFALADYTGEDGDGPELATALPGWLFFFCTTYVNLIVLLNLLIAIMNDTFEERWNRASAVFLRQRAHIVLEFERTVQFGLDTGERCDRKMVFSYPDKQQHDNPRDKRKEAEKKLDALEKESKARAGMDEEAEKKAQARQESLEKRLDEMLLESRRYKSVAQKLDALEEESKARAKMDEEAEKKAQARQESLEKKLDKMMVESRRHESLAQKLDALEKESKARAKMDEEAEKKAQARQESLERKLDEMLLESRRHESLVQKLDALEKEKESLERKLDEMLLESRRHESLVQKLDALEKESKARADTLFTKMEALSTAVEDVRPQRNGREATLHSLPPSTPSPRPLPLSLPSLPPLPPSVPPPCPPSLPGHSTHGNLEEGG